MNLLTAIVLMGCSGYVLLSVFDMLHHMSRKTPRLIAWRTVLAGSLGVYGFLNGALSLCGQQPPEWYQLVALAIIAGIFAFSPRPKSSGHGRLSGIR